MAADGHNGFDPYRIPTHVAVEGDDDGEFNHELVSHELGLARQDRIIALLEHRRAEDLAFRDQLLDVLHGIRRALEQRPG
jgi:hypothetical protein